MADAGKIAPTYDGEWSADKTYDFHTYVTHNDNCYIAKQQSTGVEPTEEDNAYWFLALKNVSASEINNIINGTTTVGDSNKLGGKGASDFVGKSQGYGWAEPNFNSYDINDWCRDGSYCYSPDCANKPHGDYGTIFVVAPLGKNMICQLSYDWNEAYQPFRTRYSNNGGTTWSEWDYLNSSVLANYLPKSGGELTGRTGISAPDVTPLVINNTTANAVYSLITFYANSSHCGALGFNGANNPIFYGANGSIKTLLHTGNVGDYAIPKDAFSYANLDFNTAYENAIYYGSGTPSQEGATNYPVDSTGTLVVFGNSGTGTQMYFTYSGSIYQRSRHFSIGWTSWKELHHDGNSAKVAIQESAPTDTTSAWLDTSNKKTKAYIDGAWTVMA